MLIIPMCCNCIYLNACDNFPSDLNFSCWVHDTNTKEGDCYII